MPEPARKKRAAGDVLVTTPAGYVLQVADGALDRDRFERLASDGREALSAGRATRAAELCREALALWRGPALAEFAYEAWAQAEAERLEELRLTCLEERIEADLRLGHDAELVPELEALVAEHPLRERPRAQLMLALYRAGRQAEALELYQQTRRLLVEELGIDPGAELRELEAAILRQDVKLAAPPVQGLPEGTVTLLATDIEGSTRLLHEVGVERYAEALQEHRRLLREAFSRHGGVEVDTQGDAFLVSFSTAPAALRAAESALTSLSSGPIRVRIGLHTGAPIRTNEGYVGVDLHRVARIAAAGHGGQVLVSEATARLIDDADLRDLGEHRLKDLTAPVRIYQLGDEQFPPLKTLHQTNLPVQPTPLVGREAELSRVLELLDQSRLVTLTGAGGSGKTRLALQAAAELVDEFEDGVWWVSLAALRDPELVEPTISQAIGAKDALVDHVRDKETLLLLDNLEQLLPVAPWVSALLAEAADVRVLATSRERLGIAAEQEFQVPVLTPTEAVALFVARARQLNPDFKSDASVAEICRRLDGLPLAIELAAARVKVLRPEEILERLGNSLDLLTGGARDAPERQQTLRATIQWSYDLLDAREKELFAQLGVFARSFDFNAVEAICSAELDVLAGLVDKSLVRRTDEGRFFLLETIGEYARERLERAPAAEEARRRHADYYLRRVEPLTWELRDMEPAAVAYVDAERDNLRAALDWAIDRGEKELAERLLCSIWFDWFIRGRTDEGDVLAQRIVDMSGGSTPSSSGIALSIAGEFARTRGDLDRAATLKEASLEVTRALSDHTFSTPDVTDLAHIEARRGNLQRARSLAEEALALRWDEERRGIGFKGGIAHARYALADVEYRAGNSEIAEQILEEIIESERRDEKIADLPEELVALAQVRRRLGKRGEAIAALREGMRLARDLRHELDLCGCFELSAYLAFDDGRRLDAVRLWAAAERLRFRAGFEDFFDADEHERFVDRAKGELGDEAFTSAAREGRGLELEDAVAYALAVIAAVATSLTPAV